MSDVTPHRVCVRCVMDTSDPDIAFDAAGVCNHCRAYAEIVPLKVPAPERREAELQAVVDRIKAEGAGKPYDSIIGVSGGTDSSYVALLAKRLGLRPLAVHFDNGWNSESAVHNIERLLDGLGMDLHTHVVDWPEFRDLQLAFLRAGVVDIELLTDHAITALVHRVARERGVRFILTGTNYATEFGMPPAWTHRKSDLRNLRAIARDQGLPPIRSLPTASTLRLLFNQYALRMESVALLNYVDYDKDAAMDELSAEVGWRYYGGKHHESLFTRFYQAHILPVKFGVDKRRVHLSAMINSRQMTRETALAQLGEPLYDPALLATDTQYVAKKWRVAEEELEALLRAPARSHLTFPSDELYIRPLLNVKAGVRALRARGRGSRRLAT